MRSVILVVTLLFILGFAGLVVASIADTGIFGPLELLALLVLAMFLFGIVGALRHPPAE